MRRARIKPKVNLIARKKSQQSITAADCTNIIKNEQQNLLFTNNEATPDKSTKLEVNITGANNIQPVPFETMTIAASSNVSMQASLTNEQKPYSSNTSVSDLANSDTANVNNISTSKLPQSKVETIKQTHEGCDNPTNVTNNTDKTIESTSITAEHVDSKVQDRKKKTKTEAKNAKRSCGIENAKISGLRCDQVEKTSACKMENTAESSTNISMRVIQQSTSKKSALEINKNDKPIAENESNFAVDNMWTCNDSAMPTHIQSLIEETIAETTENAEPFMEMVMALEDGDNIHTDPLDLSENPYSSTLPVAKEFLFALDQSINLTEIPTIRHLDPTSNANFELCNEVVIDSNNTSTTTINSVSSEAYFANKNENMEIAENNVLLSEISSSNDLQQINELAEKPVILNVVTINSPKLILLNENNEEQSNNDCNSTWSTRTTDSASDVQLTSPLANVLNESISAISSNSNQTNQMNESSNNDSTTGAFTLSADTLEYLKNIPTEELSEEFLIDVSYSLTSINESSDYIKKIKKEINNIITSTSKEKEELLYRINDRVNSVLLTHTNRFTGNHPHPTMPRRTCFNNISGVICGNQFKAHKVESKSHTKQNFDTDVNTTNSHFISNYKLHDLSNEAPCCSTKAYELQSNHTQSKQTTTSINAKESPAKLSAVEAKQREYSVSYLLTPTTFLDNVRSDINPGTQTTGKREPIRTHRLLKTSIKSKNKPDSLTEICKRIIRLSKLCSNSMESLNLDYKFKQAVEHSKYNTVPKHHTHETCVKLIKPSNCNEQWSIEDTIKFYGGLKTFGTNFQQMLQLLPQFNLEQLKNKFKTENLSNTNLVNDVLMDPSNFDIDSLRQVLQTQNVTKTAHGTTRGKRQRSKACVNARKKDPIIAKSKEKSPKAASKKIRGKRKALNQTIEDNAKAAGGVTNCTVEFFEAANGENCKQHVHASSSNNDSSMIRSATETITNVATNPKKRKYSSKRKLSGMPANLTNCLPSDGLLEGAVNSQDGARNQMESAGTDPRNTLVEIIESEYNMCSPKKSKLVKSLLKFSRHLKQERNRPSIIRKQLHLVLASKPKEMSTIEIDELNTVLAKSAIDMTEKLVYQLKYADSWSNAHILPIATDPNISDVPMQTISQSDTQVKIVKTSNPNMISQADQMVVPTAPPITSVPAVATDPLVSSVGDIQKRRNAKTESKFIIRAGLMGTPSAEKIANAPDVTMVNVNTDPQPTAIEKVTTNARAVKKVSFQDMVMASATTKAVASVADVSIRNVTDEGLNTTPMNISDMSMVSATPELITSVRERPMRKTKARQVACRKADTITSVSDVTILNARTELKPNSTEEAALNTRAEPKASFEESMMASPKVVRSVTDASIANATNVGLMTPPTNISNASTEPGAELVTNITDMSIVIATPEPINSISDMTIRNAATDSKIIARPGQMTTPIVETIPIVADAAMLNTTMDPKPTAIEKTILIASTEPTAVLADMSIVTATLPPITNVDDVPIASAKSDPILCDANTTMVSASSEPKTMAREEGTTIAKSDLFVSSTSSPKLSSAAEIFKAVQPTVNPTTEPMGSTADIPSKATKMPNSNSPTESDKPNKTEKELNRPSRRKRKEQEVFAEIHMAKMVTRTRARQLLTANRDCTKETESPVCKAIINGIKETPHDTAVEEHVLHRIKKRRKTLHVFENIQAELTSNNEEEIITDLNVAEEHKPKRRSKKRNTNSIKHRRKTLQTIEKKQPEMEEDMSNNPSNIIQAPHCNKSEMHPEINVPEVESSQDNLSSKKQNLNTEEYGTAVKVVTDMKEPKDTDIKRTKQPDNMDNNYSILHAQESHIEMNEQTLKPEIYNEMATALDIERPKVQQDSCIDHGQNSKCKIDNRRKTRSQSKRKSNNLRAKNRRTKDSITKTAQPTVAEQPTAKSSAATKKLYSFRERKHINYKKKYLYRRVTGPTTAMKQNENPGVANKLSVEGINNLSVNASQNADIKIRRTRARTYTITQSASTTLQLTKDLLPQVILIRLNLPKGVKSVSATDFERQSNNEQKAKPQSSSLCCNEINNECSAAANKAMLTTALNKAAEETAAQSDQTNEMANLSVAAMAHVTIYHNNADVSKQTETSVQAAAELNVVKRVCNEEPRNSTVDNTSCKEVTEQYSEHTSTASSDVPVETCEELPPKVNSMEKFSEKTEIKTHQTLREVVEEAAHKEDAASGTDEQLERNIDVALIQTEGPQSNEIKGVQSKLPESAENVEHLGAISSVINNTPNVTTSAAVTEEHAVSVPKKKMNISFSTIPCTNFSTPIDCSTQISSTKYDSDVSDISLPSDLFLEIPDLDMEGDAEVFHILKSTTMNSLFKPHKFRTQNVDKRTPSTIAIKVPTPLKLFEGNDILQECKGHTSNDVCDSESTLLRVSDEQTEKLENTGSQALALNGSVGSKSELAEKGVQWVVQTTKNDTIVGRIENSSDTEADNEVTVVMDNNVATTDCMYFRVITPNIDHNTAANVEGTGDSDYNKAAFSPIQNTDVVHLSDCDSNSSSTGALNNSSPQATAVSSTENCEKTSLDITSTQSIVSECSLNFSKMACTTPPPLAPEPATNVTENTELNILIEELNTTEEIMNCHGLEYAIKPLISFPDDSRITTSDSESIDTSSDTDSSSSILSIYEITSIHGGSDEEKLPEEATKETINFNISTATTPMDILMDVPSRNASSGGSDEQKIEEEIIQSIESAHNSESLENAMQKESHEMRREVNETERATTVADRGISTSLTACHLEKHVTADSLANVIARIDENIVRDSAERDISTVARNEMEHNRKCSMLAAGEVLLNSQSDNTAAPAWNTENTVPEKNMINDDAAKAHGKMKTVTQSVAAAAAVENNSVMNFDIAESPKSTTSSNGHDCDIDEILTLLSTNCLVIVDTIDTDKNPASVRTQLFIRNKLTNSLSERPLDLPPELMNAIKCIIDENPPGNG